MTPGLRIATRAIIVRDGLIALAAFDDESGYHYNFPGGGLQSGESLYDGLRREIREEIGCEITIGPLLLVYENLFAADVPLPPGGIRHGLSLLFQCELAPGSEPHLPARPDRNEVDVCWVPLTLLLQAPVLPPLGAEVVRALGERETHALQDPLVVDELRDMPSPPSNWLPLPPGVISTDAERGEPLESLLNYRQIHPGLFTGGMPSARRLQSAVAAGVEAVINLASESGGVFLQNEAEVCARLGLSYTHLPVDWEAPTTSDYLAFEAALSALQGRRVLVHCRRNYRASAFVYLWQVRRGEDEAAARADLLSVWTPNATWQALIDAVLAMG